MRPLSNLTVSEGHGDSAPVALSELQQSLHAAGVLPYLHGGSVSGAGQHVQNLILPFQLRFCLQGQVLQLQQHLQIWTVSYFLVFFFLKRIKQQSPHREQLGSKTPKIKSAQRLKPMENERVVLLGGRFGTFVWKYKEWSGR